MISRVCAIVNVVQRQQVGPNRIVLICFFQTSPNYWIMNSKGCEQQIRTNSKSVSLESSMAMQFSKDSSLSCPEQSLPGIISALERVCYRLEQSIDNQNQRLRSIQLCLSQTLSGKFDKLIEISSLISQTVWKLSDGSTPIRIPQEAPTIQQPPSPLRKIIPPVKKKPSNGNTRTQTVSPFFKQTQNVQFVFSPTTPEPVKLHPSIKIEQYEKSEPFNMIISQYNEQKPTPLTREDLSNITSKGTLMVLMQKKLGRFCSDLTEEMYNEFTRNKMDQREFKTRFSWSLLEYVRHMTQEIRASELPMLSNSRIELMILIDQVLRNVLEFLIQKYPPSKYKIIDTQLARHVIQINRVGDLKCDILRNAHMSFADNTGKTNFTRLIKIWINQLINECKRVYPFFKSKVKEMCIDDGNTFDNDNEIEFSVDSKISESVETYTEEELDLPELNVKSPQIARILVKWIEELLINFFNPRPKILKNKYGFKTICGAGIMLPSRRKQMLTANLQAINQDPLNTIRKGRRQHMFMFLNQVFKMAASGVNGSDELPQSQVINAKIAQYLQNCNEAFMNIILSSCMELLNSVRSFYKPEQQQSNIDLVTFSVMDMVRCRCIGNKIQIKKVYNCLRRSDYLQIIRVKNKLNESTRDILLNFRIKGSFLIGQMQLALGDSKDDINDKFCHHLYELQRSFLPVLFQVANHVNTCDTRVSYFNDKHPVSFKKSMDYSKTIYLKSGVPMCSTHHNQVEIKMKQNKLPFCCLVCSTFYQAFTFSLNYGRCPQCHISICPPCLLQNMPELEDEFMKKAIDYDRYAPICSDQSSYLSFFGNFKGLKNKIMQILETVDYVLVFRLDRQGCKRHVYKKGAGSFVPSFYTIDQIQQDYVNDSKFNWNIIMLLNEHKVVKLNSLRHHKKWMIQNSVPGFEGVQILKRNNIDDVLVIPSKIEKEVFLLDIPETSEAIKQQNSKQFIINRLIEEDNKPQGTIELTSKGLKDLTILDIVHNPCNIRVINLWENKLDSSVFTSLKRFKNLADLQLRENKIEQIQNFLSFEELKVLNIEKNLISGQLPELNQLPRLYLLGLNDNALTSINNLSRTSSNKLTFLYLNNNKLAQLPCLDLPQLELIEFCGNKITSLENIKNSKLPRLRRLFGNNNMISNLPGMDFPDLEVLELRGNCISDINEFSQNHLLCLVDLDLSNNAIVGELPRFSLPKLEKLVLRKNHITCISNLSKSDLHSIFTIDVSDNEIVTLPVLRLQHLKQLLLSNNKIEQLITLVVSELFGLQKLDLSGNKIEVFEVLNLRSIRQLDLSNNLIKDILCLQESLLYRLQILNLKNNKITSAVPVLDMPNLSRLMLDNNDVSELRCLTEMQLIPLIEEISFHGNFRLDKAGFLPFESEEVRRRRLSLMKCDPKIKQEKE